MRAVAPRSRGRGKLSLRTELEPNVTSRQVWQEGGKKVTEQLRECSVGCAKVIYDRAPNPDIHTQTLTLTPHFIFVGIG